MISSSISGKKFFFFLPKTRARRSIGANNYRRVISQKIGKVCFENIVAIYNKKYVKILSFHFKENMFDVIT